MGVNGREPDKDHVKAITEWPAPTNAKQARRFIGLCGTVQLWIPNYFQIASSITSTWRKGKDFEWTSDCQDTFDELKALIISAPALTFIDYTCDQPIILSIDSSYLGDGNILSQIDEHGKKRPTRYGSLPFSRMRLTILSPN